MTTQTAKIPVTKYENKQGRGCREWLWRAASLILGPASRSSGRCSTLQAGLRAAQPLTTIEERYSEVATSLGSKQRGEVDVATRRPPRPSQVMKSTVDNAFRDPDHHPALFPLGETRAGYGVVGDGMKRFMWS